MFRDACAVAGKDLLIERRSHVAAGQIVPFALTLLVLFGFALDPDRGTLELAAAGLVWLAVLLSAILATQRSYAIESGGPGAGLDGLRIGGFDPVAVFLGKSAAIATQLLLLEVVLAAGAFTLYDVEPTGWLVLVVTAAVGTLAVSAACTLYGAIALGDRGRETLVPLLLLPALGPALLAATKATEAAFAGASDQAWPWVQLLALMAAGFVVAGVLAYGSLMEGDA